MTQTYQPQSMFGGITPTPLDLGINPNEPEVTGAVITSSSSNPLLVQEAKKYNLVTIPDEGIVLFGSDRQKQIGQSLDQLLNEITKGDNPILFELFRKLNKGVKDADLASVEEEIRKSQEGGMVSGLLDSLGLSSVAKRLEKANEKISSMLTSKSKSLLDLTREMEAEIQKEVLKLIGDAKRLTTLASEYRTNVVEFGKYVEIGKLVLEDAKAELGRKQAHAAQTNAPLDIEEARLFQQKVELFETRLVTIETIYQKAPAELEAIRLSQGAALSTLSETANSALEEFNDIKSVLIKLSVSHQIKTVQAMNNERQKLRDSLQVHGTNLLGETAVAAANAQGTNRVNDATRLLEFATKIKDISAKVESEKAQNQTRFAEARQKLADVKKLVG